MTSKNSDRAALERLTTAFVEDILNASDEDILAEAREDYRAPGDVAAATRAQFEKAVTADAKGRLAAAKAAVASDRRLLANVIRLDPAEARRRLERIIARDPKLTLAARKGHGLSDEDVQGMLEDLENLGLAPDSDEP